MNRAERNVFTFLLILAAGLITISMITGPIGMEVTSIATAVSAIGISGALIFYALHFWRKKKL